jgi:hypothetical protein
MNSVSCSEFLRVISHRDILAERCRSRNRLTYSPTPAAGYDAPMNFSDIAARVHRLEQLSIGLAMEISIWQECNDSLFYVERHKFLIAIRDAHSGIESARVR